MKKIILRYGIYSSLTLVVLFGLTFLFGKNLDFGASEKLGYASILIGMIFVYLGIREYREKIGMGKISFWKAVKVGLLIVSIPSIVFGLIDVIYVTFIDPDFIENFYNHSLAELKTSLPAAEYEIKAAEMESQRAMFSNVFFQFIVMGLTVFLIGIVASFVSSFILKTED
ncbi:MAG: DUF4199 domain-containing protein [Saprospiraceae bacterium]